ncbi:winged helix-turn-helix domain-containing protein [Sphingomonas xinjiangensis]|uniref:DNA-binding MarR family transcriptional regulator n=1 Tax=Sphingomonas xinjiangensis TaxID=643568 RepID=A0A840YKQ4_9SPHN|nr:transcriptional regulator [Sphingomonas xinjiangensis]MBB5711778.1 DNA-binding MarR family transcriptional regulator [Sphingomonas xinjiangensis]
MTAGGFDPVIHAPNRLQICAMLSAVDSAEFGTIRDTLGVSDSVLSKHVRQLDEAGYVKLSKAVVDTRQRTWLSLTRQGRKAFEAHVLELEKLVAQARSAPFITDVGGAVTV